RDSGVGRIVLGPAGREGAAVLGEGAWVDGKDDEEVVLEEGGDDGALRQLEAHGDGATAETLAQGACPCVDDRGPMLDDRELEGIGLRDLEADIVLSVGPVAADARGERGRYILHDI